MNLYSTRVSDLDNQDEASLCKAYLRICRKLPNYGLVQNTIIIFGMLTLKDDFLFISSDYLLLSI